MRWRRIPEDEPRAREPVLRDRTLDARLRRDGFVVVPLLDANAVDHLTQAFADLGPPTSTSSYHHDLWGHDRDRKVQARAVIGPWVRPGLARILHDHEPRTLAFIRKPPGPTTAVGPHVDLSFVDESRWRSVMVWCSLTGADPGEGLLHVVPRSHRIRSGVRAHGDVASTFPALVEDIIERWGVALRVPAGHAAIFDHGTVHYAEPNLSSSPQLLVQAVCTPTAARLLYPLSTRPGRAEVYAVDDDFYIGFSLDDRPDANLLEQYPLVDEVDTPLERLTTADLEAVGRPRRRRLVGSR